MNEQVRQGRIIVLVIILGTILMSLAIIGYYNAVVGPGKLPQQTVRFVLTLLLMFFLYKGHVLARLIAVILFGLTGLLGILAGVGGGSGNPLVILLSVVCGMSALVLLTSSSVRAFLDAQNERQVVSAAAVDTDSWLARGTRFASERPFRKDDDAN